jgi:hypothetical protein
MSRRSLLCCAVPMLGISLAASAEDYRFSGPYTHDNLSIFVIHGGQRQRTTTFLTLQEALDQKKVVVYETGNVNELAIENFSGEDVYIQSGDIVKGGQQDRVFPDDFVLPKTSGRVPISSFCVEQGRWTRRGTERADQFSASADTLPTKSLKLAARKSGNQQQVWEQVAMARVEITESAGSYDRTDGARLGTGVGGGVGGGVRAFSPSAASSTSMQLALENKKVTQATEAYIKHLSKIFESQPDAIGYAFAINGKLNSADVYASRELFARMWPKLLKASATEAMAERSTEKSSAALDATAVRAAFAEAEHGHESSKDVNQRLDIVMRETDKAVLFETRDREQGGASIHKSYVIK